MYRKLVKILTALCIMTLLMTIMVGCSGQTVEMKEVTNQPVMESLEDGKILVYTSLFPLYDFAKRIGGDQVIVKNLLPIGADAHDYEPTAKEMIALSEADLFFYNGAGFELWIEKLLNSIRTDSDVIIVNTTEGIPLLEVGEAADEHHHSWFVEAAYWLMGLFGFGDDHHHAHGPNDPHVWLDPTLALKQAEKILDQLILIEPDLREYFEGNFQVLRDELLQLDEAFQLSLQDLENRSIVVSHSGYNYLANRYDLHQVAITGIHPGSEPSKRELRKIIDFIIKEDISHVFFEPTISNKTAQVISNEVGATILTLHPLENITDEEQSNGEGYVSLMYRNLEQLLLALTNSN